MAKRYLTKSRFKLGLECPAKLFYTGKKEYANQRLEDPFLASLAEGGFQVGELAKAYYPEGHDIETLDMDEALAQTNELLREENCVIFEAAITYENLFVRVDLLIKEGDHIQLVEVKAKSANSDAASQFVGAKGGIRSEWKEYVYDLAFQHYVAERALENYRITPYLMLVDKRKAVPTSELNQKFKIKKDENARSYVKMTAALTKEEEEQRILVSVDTTNLCRRIMDEDLFPYLGKEIRFGQLIEAFASHYERDEQIEAGISRACKGCEFKASHADKQAGLKSGYETCFTRQLGWTEEDFAVDTIFDLRAIRHTDDLIKQNKIKLTELKPTDVKIKTDHSAIDEDKPLKTAERNWLYLESVQNKDTSIYLNKEKLRKEMATWKYPLHFIDFETAQPAIPLHKGSRPYETIAFQYSHHIVYEDGMIEHKSEYLNTDVGVHPNIDFVRHLKKSLEEDEGTIFRYSHHENTVLNKIYDQLELIGDGLEDKAELQAFIFDITRVTSKEPKREGKRNMVDLCKLVEDYYFDPYMKGSTSIKVVLPAILHSSAYIQEKYSKPIYGAVNGIKSLNFTGKQWVKIKDGQVTDPYALLPKLFQDLSKEEHQFIELHEDINNGGAAMTAYERLQSEDIPSEIRAEIEAGMKKYCELDTLAMVLIYEAWVDMLKE